MCPSSNGIVPPPTRLTLREAVILERATEVGATLAKAGVQHGPQSWRRGQVEDTLNQHQVRISVNVRLLDVRDGRVVASGSDTIALPAVAAEGAALGTGSWQVSFDVPAGFTAEGWPRSRRPPSTTRR